MASDNDRLQRAIDEINKVQEAFNKAAENTQDVKDGKCTAEDEKAEPGFVLFNQISKCVLETLQSSEISTAFVNIGKTLGADVSANLVNIVAICCATSAHNAICFYDEMLKAELTKSFAEVTKHLNNCKADMAAYQSVLKVYQKRIEALERPGKINQVMKDAGVPIKGDNT